MDTATCEWAVVRQMCTTGSWEKLHLLLTFMEKGRDPNSGGTFSFKVVLSVTL